MGVPAEPALNSVDACSRPKKLPSIPILRRESNQYPIRARTFQSRVYEYYDPAVNAVARPVALEVRKK